MVVSGDGGIELDVTCRVNSAIIDPPSLFCFAILTSDCDCSTPILFLCCCMGVVDGRSPPQLIASSKPSLTPVSAVAPGYFGPT